MLAKKPKIQNDEEEREERKVDPGLSLLDPELVDCSPEQRYVIDAAVVKKYNMFITGVAGTGKTYVLNKIIQLVQNAEEEGLECTATTGLAATHINGCTFHSWLRLGLASGPVDKLVRDGHRSNRCRMSFTSTNRLVIDEVSMLDPKFLQLLDELGRGIRYKTRHLPFGGIQLLVCGDFRQLGCIKPQGKESHLFESSFWNDLVSFQYEMTRVFRQDNKEFVDLLKRASVAECTPEDFNLLKSKILPYNYKVLWEEKEEEDKKAGKPIDKIKPTILYSTNKDVDAENLEHLYKLEPDRTKHHIFTYSEQFKGMNSRNQHSLKEYIKTQVKNNLAKPEIELALGAQVLLLKNLDQKLQLVNGSQGVIIGFERAPSFMTNSNSQNDVKYPRVLFSNDVTRVITPSAWTFKSRGGEASYLQVPLRLGYSLSIHKSQGMTLTKLIADLGNCFAPGQAFVALSRAKSLDQVHFVNVANDCFKAEKSVKEYYEKLIRDQKKNHPKAQGEETSTK